jgi:hypothetical protein
MAQGQWWCNAIMQPVYPLSGKHIRFEIHKESPNKSVRGECSLFAPSKHRATRGTGGTTDMTTSHLTNPAKDAG